jgi:hypothetical protein
MNNVPLNFIEDGSVCVTYSVSRYVTKNLNCKLFVMAGWTGLEPATSGVTGRRSNQTELPPLDMVGGTGLEPVTPGL